MRGFDRCGVFSTYSRVASFFGVAKALEERFEGVLGGWSSDFRLREAWGGDLPVSVARRFSYSLYFAAFRVRSVDLVSCRTYQCRRLQQCPFAWASGREPGGGLFPRP